MMTDGELLELAAKAYASEDVIKTMRGFERVVGYSEAMCCQIMTEWNPLTDDGDALRLAAKLSMRIDTCVKTGCAARYGIDCENVIYVGISSDNDLLKATRRAIVRAAAQIGAQM